MPPLASDAAKQSYRVLAREVGMCDAASMMLDKSKRGMMYSTAALQAAFAIACADAEPAAENDAATSGSVQTAPPAAMSTAGSVGSSAQAGQQAQATAGARAAPTASAMAGSTAPAQAGSAGTAGSVEPGMAPSMNTAGMMAAMTPMAAGSGGAEAGAGGAETMAPALPDLGMGDGSDVVTIGDSWMSFAINGGGIEGALDRAGTKYPHYGIPGTLLLNGQIPSQYDQAKRDHPMIATVIMTGGGNDVMASNGCETKETCAKTVQGIIDAFDELYMKMIADGVTSAVLINYSKFAGSGPKDTRPEVLPTPTSCTTGKLRCLVIETSDIVSADDLLDGVHPTMPATDRIAMRTLEQMEEAGVRR
jgi:hypothetical protein